MKMQEKVKNTDEINFGMEVDLLTEEESIHIFANILKKRQFLYEKRSKTIFVAYRKV